MRNLFLGLILICSFVLFSFTSASENQQLSTITVHENNEISKLQTAAKESDADSSWILAWSDGISGILAWETRQTIQ